MNYADLIQNISTHITTNGSQAITAQVLQDVLKDMVEDMGQSGSLIGGVVDTSFIPEVSDANIIYIAETPGVYTHFNGAVVNTGELALFYYDGEDWQKWSAECGFATASASVNSGTGTPSVAVTISGNNIDFAFSNLKGEQGIQGIQGVQGPKGDQGNTGSSVDYPYELVNNLTTNDSTKGLTAAMGMELNQDKDTKFQKLNFVVSKYAVQPSGNTGIWYGNDYNHLVLPVLPGDVLSFTKNGTSTLYYALLTDYVTPVLNVSPSFVSGYDGRLSIRTANELTIPQGTKYLIINNPFISGGELTSLKINNAECINGIWNGLSSISKNIKDIDKVDSNNGYGKCFTSASTAEKTLASVSFPGFALSKNVRLLITFDSNNTANDATLKIGTLAAYPLYYRNARASATNSWEAGDTLDIRFDATNNRFLAEPFNGVLIEKDLPSIKEYAQSDVVKDNDLTIENVSNNIANPDDITDGQSVNNGGQIINRTDLIGRFKTLTLDVEEGQKISFGGFDLGRSGYYAFYNDTTLVSVSDFTQQQGISGCTVTVPSNANLLYINIQMSGNPSTPTVMANYGESLLQYEQYKEAITKINNIELVGSGTEGLSTLITDLPVSATGEEIGIGYAYINSTTGVVTIKMS